MKMITWIHEGVDCRKYELFPESPHSFSKIFRNMSGETNMAKQKAAPPVVIPEVPPGVVDPNDMYNDAYQDLPPLRWKDPRFHDRLAWVTEQQPHTIEKWYAIRNSSPETSFLCQTMFLARLPNGESYEVDTRNVNVYPEALLYSLMSVAGNPPDVVPQYPGFEARHPKEGSSPIGDPLENQPWQGRTLYEDVGGDTYAVGEEFKDENGDRYTKLTYVVPPRGSAEAWEKTFSAA